MRFLSHVPSRPTPTITPVAGRRSWRTTKTEEAKTSWGERGAREGAEGGQLDLRPRRPAPSISRRSLGERARGAFVGEGGQDRGLLGLDRIDRVEGLGSISIDGRLAPVHRVVTNSWSVPSPRACPFSTVAKPAVLQPGPPIRGQAVRQHAGRASWKGHLGNERRRTPSPTDH